MARLIKNPKQTADSQIYYDHEHVAITFPKSGYYFSDDEAMDGTVNYFIEELGFQLVTPKSSEPKKTGLFNKDK